MNKQEHYPIYPALNPNLRKNKRLMTHEATVVGRKLGEVEQLMAKSVNDPWMSYEDAYQIYLGVYQKVISKLNPKYIQIDQMYFKTLYKPVDDCKIIYSFITDLHDLARMLLGQREEINE